MLQSRSVFVGNKVPYKLPISFIQFHPCITKRDPSAINNGKVATHMLNIVHPTNGIFKEINGFFILGHTSP